MTFRPSAHGEVLTVFAPDVKIKQVSKFKALSRVGTLLLCRSPLVLMLVCSLPNVTLQACMEGTHVVIIELQGSSCPCSFKNQVQVPLYLLKC